MKAFLEEVAQDLKKRLGKELENSALIFVSKRPMLFMQKYLVQDSHHSAWGPRMFTIQEFLGLSTDYKIASGLTQFFTLWEAYSHLLSVKEKNTMKMDAFYPIGISLISDFLELDEQMISIEALYSNLREVSAIDQKFDSLTKDQIRFLESFWSSFSPSGKNFIQEEFIKLWDRMPRLYKGFHNGLKEKGLTTQGKIYRELAEGIHPNPSFLDEFQTGKIAFIGFNALSRAEATLFQKWQTEERTLFYFDWDAYYMEDEIQEAGKFLRFNRNELQLENALGTALPHLKTRSPQIQIHSMAGHVAQAKILPDLMKDLEAIHLGTEEGLIRTAIITADESLLIPVLQSFPENFSGQGQPIPINITMGLPLVSSLLFGFLELWIIFQENNNQQKEGWVMYKDLEALLNHPYIPENRAKVEEFREKILKEQRVEIKVSEVLSLLPQTEKFLMVAPNPAQSLYNLLDIMDDLRGRFPSLLGALEAELMIALVQNIRNLIEALTQYSEILPLSLFYSLLRKSLKQVTTPLSGEPLKGLQIMGLMETRSLDFETIFILGASEGNIPKRISKETLIPDSIRKAYGLYLEEDRDALWAYVFYRLFHRSRKIHILFNSIQDENNTGEPSRFIRQLEFESLLPFLKQSYSPHFSLNSQRGILVEKKGKLVEVLKTYYSNLGSNKKTLSATAFTHYLACPLRFFYQYCAQIKPPITLSESISPVQIGDLIHGILFSFYQRLRLVNSLIQPEQIEIGKKDIQVLVEETYSKIIFKEEGARTRNFSGKDQIILVVLKQYVTRVLNHDQKLAPFILKELENITDYVLDFPILVRGETITIRLKGVIDRMDEKDGVYRIVDYKTGKESSTYSSLNSEFDSDNMGFNKALVQTLYYTLIASKKLNIEPEPHLYVLQRLEEETAFLKKFPQKPKKPIIRIFPKRKRAY